MSKSKIEWTDVTWNPVTGCTPVSRGCDNCYAERMHRRFSDGPFSEIRFHPDRLDQPLRWRKPRRVFVCSMGDLFHEDLKWEWIDNIFHVMRGASQHKYMVLTKRPDRMKKYMGQVAYPNRTMTNLWLGVSVEDQATADERIPILLNIPAALRFVSVEPMLGPVDLTSHYWTLPMLCHLNWVICGSESGPRRRPCDPDWIRSLRGQCVSAGVPFFLKQMDVGGKLVKMPKLDGRVWDEFPKGAK